MVWPAIDYVSLEKRMEKQQSSLFADLYSGPPQHTNEQGVKFWLDLSLTQYARKKGLADVQVLLVEELNGHRTRLVAVASQPVFDSPSFEAVAVHLDIMALAAKAEKDEVADGPGGDSDLGDSGV